MALSMKKKIGAAGAAGALVLTGGIAFAYWTSTGTGSDTSQTGTSDNFSVVVTNTTDNALSPDGPIDTYSYTVTNTGDGDQALENQPVITITTNAAGCDPAWFAVTNASTITTPLNLEPNGQAGDSYTGGFDVQLVNLPAVNQDACQGAEVTATVDVS